MTVDQLDVLPGRPGVLPGRRIAAPLTVTDDELQLWMLRRPWTESAARPLTVSGLDDRERERAASFQRPQDRLLYVSAHLALRRVLAACLGVHPRDVLLGREPCPGCGGPHGRPVVADAPFPLHFSLSHSHGLVLIAVATHPVGVDVEQLPSAETVDLCTPSLHPAEQKELALLPTGERRRAFTRLWTRKEAYLKAIGTGLSRDLSADYLGEREGPGAPPGPAGWTVRNVPTGSRHSAQSDHSGHCAAVAFRSAQDHCCTVRRLPEDSLYADDATATGIVAAVEPRVCALLPVSRALT
ncbi:4'-phosphopantetheinyl transferase family protein [Streptomyces sp. NPDC059909]|uniref:4'-phosphopantetheinyl transferase family protein n=1 Tax=Streptomyces sp. NPDC059909 TaxID=3346998 RepID=UPI00365C5B3F